MGWLEDKEAMLKEHEKAAAPKKKAPAKKAPAKKAAKK